MGWPNDLEGFGEEIENYTYTGALDWFIKIRNPVEVFNAQPTFFLAECNFVIIALLSLIHLSCHPSCFHLWIVAIDVGRWKYHWLACYLHGMTTEMVSVMMPDIDSYWQSQTTVMLMGRRLPFHIPLIYPSFMYHAAYMVAHMKLPRWAEPMAAGLMEVLIDLPYDIMCIKFVHWTWHDTDPNIYDRHYWVPWNSYYFHLTFGTAFTFALHFWRRTITGTDDKNHVSSPKKELLCALLAGLCGMPGGVIQFLFIYHPLHDTYGLHTENCFLIIAIIYFFIVWTADRAQRYSSRRLTGDKSHWSVILIIINMVLHYGLYLGMAIFGNPENEISIGLHERTGPCDKKTKVYTAIGGVLERRTYLCTKDYDEKYFDFHCLPDGEPVSDGVEWYTICGTPFSNRAEYICAISLITFVASIVFYNLLFKSSSTIISAEKSKPKEN